MRNVPPPERAGEHFRFSLIYWRDNDREEANARKQNNTSKLQQVLSRKKTRERVAKSPDAKALASLLTQGQDQASLKQIAESAAKGDTSQLNQLIQSIANNPSGAELLRRLGESFGKK